MNFQSKVYTVAAAAINVLSYDKREGIEIFYENENVIYIKIHLSGLFHFCLFYC